MEDGSMPIGLLARRSGLPVKTIRFYSDEGLLPPSDRTEAGYRLYGETELARLELIRTLRDAGVDLPTIRAVLERDLSLGEALQLVGEAAPDGVGRELVADDEHGRQQEPEYFRLRGDQRARRTGGAGTGSPWPTCPDIPRRSPISRPVAPRRARPAAS